MLTKTRIFKLLQILGAVLLLGFLFSQVSWGKIQAVIAESNPAFLFLAYLLYLLSTFLQSARWYILATALNVPLTLFQANRITFLSLFADLFIPGRLGGDAFKIAQTPGKANRTSTLGALLFLRIQGLGINLLIFGLAGIAFAASGSVRVVAAFVLLGLAVVAFLLYRKPNLPVFDFGDGNGTRLLGKAKRLLQKMVSVFADFRQQSKVLMLTSVLTVFFVLSSVLVYYFAGHAIGLRLGFGQFLVSVPALMVAAVLPITIHGRGVKEILAVYFWQNVDNTLETVLVTILCVYFIVLIQGIISGCFWPFAHLQPVKLKEES